MYFTYFSYIYQNNNKKNSLVLYHSLTTQPKFDAVLLIFSGLTQILKDSMASVW